MSFAAPVLSSTGPAGARGPGEPFVLLVMLAAALTVSGIAPADRRIWILEEAPILLAAAVLVATFWNFPLTRWTYRLLFFHALLIAIGGHYTYSGVPAGLWWKDVLGLSRNHFDRIVHFVGGLAPAVLAREILLRKTRLRPGGWLFSLVALSCLGGSAIYEILEWWAARLSGFDAATFLATQGDVWDTQWDMFLGLAGAVAGQLLFGRLQDRELADRGALETPDPRGASGPPGT